MSSQETGSLIESLAILRRRRDQLDAAIDAILAIVGDEKIGERHKPKEREPEPTETSASRVTPANNSGRKKFWTDEKSEELASLYNDGVGAKDIADQMDRPITDIYNQIVKVRKEGLIEERKKKANKIKNPKTTQKK